VTQISPISCDVLIIGGGPSGSALGTLLARKGHHIILLEKDRHPRFHIGESLLPLSLPYLDELGVREDIERIGLRKYSAEFHSMYHNAHSAFSFSDAVDPSYSYGYQVRRSEFDHVLLKNCADQGATVYEACRVTDVSVTQSAITQVTATHQDGSIQDYHARFYVDATGRDTFLASKLGTKFRNPKHASAALFGHFSGAKRYEGKDEGNISIYWFDFGWFWFIPLKDGTTSVGAVCHPRYLRERSKEVEDFFLETIALCPALQERLSEATLIEPVTATGNYSYQSRKMHGDNFLLIGDAFAFIDPVFSSGVHLALHGAFKGAEVIDRILHHPKQAKKELAQLEASVWKGLGVFSWFIYRVTTPAIRDLFIHPRNLFGVRSAVISILAGDLFGATSIQKQILIFKVIYALKTLFSPRTSFLAFRNRQKNMEING